MIGIYVYYDIKNIPNVNCDMTGSCKYLYIRNSIRFDMVSDFIRCQIWD